VLSGHQRYIVRVESKAVCVYVCDVGWMYVGMVGGALFIILQLILLVDFAHNWHSRWLVSVIIFLLLK